MTTKKDVLEFLEIFQQTTVLAYASRKSKLRIQTDKMRLAKLPVKSIALYIKNGADCDKLSRREANDTFEAEGFVSYRQLLPVMRQLFPDIFPKSK